MADADAITPDTAAAAAAASKTSKTLDGVEDDDDASNSSVDSPRSPGIGITPTKYCICNGKAWKGGNRMCRLHTFCDLRRIGKRATIQELLLPIIAALLPLLHPM
jgi:hypothetical protein